ncbi:MAG: type II toxin-antitoxin system CcdA family antitoxin [Thiopseudomonas sp.]|nr:type II toxin-antitoxin system CcdA family antitoxin [Thiopseudomonas sp.]
MSAVYDLQAGKKPANLSINADLLAKAKALKINLSAALETALAERISASQREQWLEENRSAIDAYNKMVEEHGVFSDELRSF